MGEKLGNRSQKIEFCADGFGSVVGSVQFGSADVGSKALGCFLGHSAIPKSNMRRPEGQDGAKLLNFNAKAKSSAVKPPEFIRKDDSLGGEKTTLFSLAKLRPGRRGCSGQTDDAGGASRTMSSVSFFLSKPWHATQGDQLRG